MDINLKITFCLDPGMSPWPTLADLQAMESRLMSVLSDKIAALETSVTGATTRVQTDVAALKQQIADLQALVASGGATPADLATLDALIAQVDQIDPTTPSVLPPAPPVPPGP